MSRRIDTCARAIAEDANRGYANRGYAGRFQPIAFLLSSTLVAGLIFSGCGSDDDDAETKFGNEAELRTYRGAINPIIDAVSNIDSMVAARAYNSSGTLATADNLNEVFLEVRPQLLEVLVELDRITPPARLAALHGDIRDLIVLRLDAYALVMEGVAAQDESLYAVAEEKLAAANAIIPDLNDTLCDIDEALGATQQCRLLA